MTLHWRKWVSNTFLVRGGTLCPVAHLSAGIFICFKPVKALWVLSLWKNIYQLCLIGAISLESSIISSSNNLPASSSIYTSESWREELGEDILFRGMSSKIFTLYSLFRCVFLVWWALSDTLIYGSAVWYYDHFIAILFYQNNCSKVSPGSVMYIVSGSWTL